VKGLTYLGSSNGLKFYLLAMKNDQDDTPGVFAEPWDYSDNEQGNLDWREEKSLLLPAIRTVSSKRDDEVTVLLDEGRYLRVLFVDGKTREESIGEFYFTPNDTTVQFRIAATPRQFRQTKESVGTLSLSSLVSLSHRNMDRAEEIRKQCKSKGFTKLFAR
jgi:hypothetical protein